MKTRIVLGLINLVFIAGAESTFSQNVTRAPQSTRAEPGCPQLVKVVNGQPIRPGAFPSTRKSASGETKGLVSVEMAMTPLEFETVAGFKMRVPASVLNISTRQCDDRGRFQSMRFDLYWVDGKLSVSAQLPKLPVPKEYEYGHKRVRAYGHFLTGSSLDVLSEKREPFIERERKWYGPPTRLPQFGFTAYPRIWRIERSERIWDAFVLDTAHDWTGSEIIYLCAVGEAEVLSRQFKPHYDWCRGGVSFQKGFGATVDIAVDLLPDAARITEQLVRIMNSYVVKE